jgi:hypothetical protein
MEMENGKWKMENNWIVPCIELLYQTAQKYEKRIRFQNQLKAIS